MKTKFLALALGATMLAGGAYAAQEMAPGPMAGPGHHRGGMMAMVDTNKDGIVTRAEALAAVDAHFAQVDTNHDGKITEAERNAAHEAMRARFGGKAGSKREARHARMLERFDADHDGQLSDAERQAARAQFAQRRGDHPMRGKHGGMGMHGDGHGMHAMMRADSNGDGVITLAEARAAATAMFDRADTNHDGKIDQAERDAVRDAMKAMRGGPGAPPPGDAPGE